MYEILALFVLAMFVERAKEKLIGEAATQKICLERDLTIETIRRVTTRQKGGGMSCKKGTARFVIVIIAAGTLFLGGGSYAGATYYQSNKLAREGDELAKSGRFDDAVVKYDKAIKKWKWQGKKIGQKRTDVSELAKEEKSFKDGEASFGKGEWQKCLEYLGQITAKNPNFKVAQERYSDCKKKLDEAAAAAVAASAAQAATTGSSSAVSSSGSKESGNSGSSSSESSNGSGGSSSNDSSSSAPPNIFGNISTASVENIVNSLPLVYSDGTGDFVTPPGGAPPSGVYAYPPIDINNLYMGAHDGRLYIKWALAGTIPPSQENANGNAIEMIVFNIRLATTPDDSGPCGGRTAFFQGNISYKDNGQIFYNMFSKSVCNNTGPYGSQDDWGFANSGSGLAHTFNSGLGKNSLVFSFALSDLGINVGDSYKTELWSEAESNLWHHYSVDQTSSDWIDWTVQGI